ALYAHANVGQILFLRIISLDPVPTLFPYTTLFRSRSAQRGCQGRYPVGGLVRMLRGASFAVAERALARRPAVSALYSRAEGRYRSEEHTSELQSRSELVCRLLLEKKK